MNQDKLLLLDAYALIFRAYYAMIRNPQTTSTGIDTSAVFGFVNTLQDLLKHRQPTFIAVCFDPAGPTFRHNAYPEYKANRDKTPEGILVAVPYIKRILEAYHIPVVSVDGYEADDVIGTLARHAEKSQLSTYMVTGDKDFAQLVSTYVKILNPAKGEILGVEEVKAKYGLQSPLQVIDMLGLMGDTADNIPGCPGVGPKTAEKLIQQFGSVENLLQNTDQLKGALQTRVRENAEQIKTSKWLATIKTDVPIEFDIESMRRRPADLERLREVFSELEFRSLTRRLIDQGEANAGLDIQPATIPPTTAATAQQPSLFDTPPETTATPETTGTPENLDLEAPQIITDTYQAEALIKNLRETPSVSVLVVDDNQPAMRARVTGIALAAEGQTTAFLPFDQMGWMAQAVAPLFDSKATIICPDVKRLIVILHAAGIAFNAPYYDTAVAHYLLQPERSHTIADIAAQMLNINIPTDALAPTNKTKRPSRNAANDIQKTAAQAATLAKINLKLTETLNSRLQAENLTRLNNDIEQPLVAVLADMEIAGVRVDVEALKDYSAVLSSQVNQLEQECQQLAGTEFNTASPAQVGEILFERLQLDPKAKKTKTGQYSTTEEILLRLRDRHPIIDKILALRAARKLLSTYVDALPALINPVTGRIHTTFNQTVTATGRLSSANPNLQNIPVRNDEGREIRRAFIPTQGNLFFSADYSQIELRLVADLSGDPTMLNAFENNQDIHAITAARIYHEELDQVTPEQRRRAKTANFGILYGISAFGLAERLNIPRAEAKMLIDGYFNTFPEVKQYINRVIEQARANGYVTTLDGRRRMLPDINSRNAVVRSFSERNAVNAPIQGSAADIIKRAMIAIHRQFKAEGLRSKMILQVHDELNFDVYPEELRRVEEIVITQMEAAYSGRVRLTASHAAASNWLDAH